LSPILINNFFDVFFLGPHFGIFKFVGGLFRNLFGLVVDKFGVWLSNKGGKIKEANEGMKNQFQQKFGKY
jgi:hypothetical protein